MPTRVYVSTASPTTLAADLTAEATSVSVANLAGWPTTFPYTAVVDRGVPNRAEILTVVAANGLTLTVQRAQDNTVATAHSAGATFTHEHSARDWTETQSRLDALEGSNGAVNFTRFFLLGGL